MLNALDPTPLTHIEIVVHVVRPQVPSLFEIRTLAHQDATSRAQTTAETPQDRSGGPGRPSSVLFSRRCNPGAGRWAVGEGEKLHPRS